LGSGRATGAVEKRFVTPAQAGVQKIGVKRIKGFLDSGLHRNDAFDAFPGFFNTLYLSG
jgi:hypothetical protein